MTRNLWAGRTTTAAALAVAVVGVLVAPLLSASPATSGEPAGCSAAAFPDGAPPNPFADDICWMAEQGISTGYGDGTYRPAAVVTRAAMSAFLYRLAGSPDFEAPSVPTFGDVADGNPFYDEIEWMAHEGITTGTEASPKPLYKPVGAVSRAAMSAFMHRLADGPGVGL